MAINLKQVQQYRYTIFIFGGLVLALISLFITELIYRNQQAPLAPITQTINPTTDTLIVDWTKVRLNQSEEDINKLFGNPTNTFEENGVKTNTYSVNPLTPLAVHVVVIKESKAIEIRRNIDSVNDLVTPQQLEKQYGTPTILREQQGQALPRLDAYNLDDNQYLVVKVNRQTNRVFELMFMNKERYDLYIEKELPAEAEDQGFSVDPEGL